MIKRPNLADDGTFWMELASAIGLLGEHPSLRSKAEMMRQIYSGLNALASNGFAENAAGFEANLPKWKEEFRKSVIVPPMGFDANSIMLMMVAALESLFWSRAVSVPKKRPIPKRPIVKKR